MKCPHFNKDHSDDTKYCPNTGKEIELLACHNRECPDLGKKILPADSKYCPTCGQKLMNRKGRSNIFEGDNPSALEFTVGGVDFTMVYVDAADDFFTMGATSEQGGDAYDWEKPDHIVTLTKDYYIGQTNVTQALWQAVMGSIPSYFKGNNRPVERVSWDDCRTFIDKLNLKLSAELDGKHFRLPTEAEWEYAARGGLESEDYKYSGGNTLDSVAWYDENSDSETHDVAQKQANELGLYDMSGNVWEWCSDWYGHYSSSSQTNPHGPSGGLQRVLRGGCWADPSKECRVSGRYGATPGRVNNGYGFRLVLSE